jgi:hypothetical protein
MDRATVHHLYFALTGGLLAVMAVFASLFPLGTAPLLRAQGTPLIGIITAVAAVSPLLLGWLWARPQVPLRHKDTPVDHYWRAPGPGSGALLLWVLWEGGAMIGTLGTGLTGSPLTASAALLGLALLVTHGPGYLETRQSS